MGDIVKQKENPNKVEIEQKEEGNSIEKTSEEKVADLMKKYVDDLRPKNVSYIDLKDQLVKTPAVIGVVEIKQKDLNNIFGVKRGVNYFNEKG